MRYLLLALFLFVACGLEPSGKEKVVERGYPPTPTTPVNPSPGPAPSTCSTFAEVQPHLQSNCSPCHTNRDFVRTEAGFLNSNSYALIVSGEMPPRGTNQKANFEGTPKNCVLSFARAKGKR